MEEKKIRRIPKRLMWYALFAFVFCAVIIGGYMQFGRTPTGVIRYDAKSARSNEFIANTSGARMATSPSGSRFATRCFLVVFPFESRSGQDLSDEKHCTFGATMISPPGRVVIGMIISQTPLDDDASVTFRRQMTDTYQEQVITVDGYDQSLLFLQEDGKTLFLKKDGYILTIAFTSMQESSIIDNDTIVSLARSIVILETQ